MYEAFFGLRTRPFNPLPRVDAYVALSPIRESLDALVRCVEQDRGIGVLTSPAGTGKSLICRLLQLHFAESRRTVLLTTGRFPTRRALLQAILFEMKHPYVGLSEQEARLRLLDLLQSSPGPLNRLLLIVDEAHLLSPKGHEELRTLTDYESGGVPLVSLVLAGQLELEETLAEPSMSALNQRVGCHVSIEPFNIEESAIYIRERLRMAGHSGLTIFTPEAIQLICSASEGNPRRLNQLCDHSLLLAYAEGTRPVDVNVVRSALLDLRELPLHWNSPVDLTEQVEENPLEQYSRSHGSEVADSVIVEDDTALDVEDAESEVAGDEMPASAVYEIGGDDENTELDSPVIDQFFQTSEFVVPSELQDDVAAFVEILKSPGEIQAPVAEEAINDETGSEWNDHSRRSEYSPDDERDVSRSEEAAETAVTSTRHSEVVKPPRMVEELIVDDPYAAIDRQQESSIQPGTAIPNKVTGPQIPAPHIEAAEPIATGLEPTEFVDGSQAEAEILELIREMSAEIQEVRSETQSGDSQTAPVLPPSPIGPAKSHSLREVLAWQFDVVEPESGEIPTAESQPSTPVVSIESPVIEVESPGEPQELADAHERKYALLFTRLQRQRRRVEAVMNRERISGHETRCP